MKDKRVRAIIVQWVIPFLILFLVMSILWLHFSVNNRTKEFKEVEQQLIGVAEDYAGEFENTIGSLMTASMPLGHLMEKYTFEEVDIATNVTQVLVDNTDAYMAVMCNIVGEGLTQTGRRVDLRNEEYFINASGVRFKYIYCDDDGIEGRRCIIAVLPMRKGMVVKGFLLVYYDAANFSDMISNRKFDATTYYSVVDNYGESICEEGPYNLFDKVNVWNSILDSAANTEELQQAKERFDNNKSGMVKIEFADKSPDKLLVYAPTNISDWKFIIVMNYSYVDRLLMNEWEDSRNILLKLLLCVLIFVGVAATRIIVSRVRENEKNKVLANKADTDLLTGLYNKGATEQRIRAYIEEHPDEQALLFVFDIDNFKKINDTMGHAFGDEVLRSLGHQIQAYFRVSDIIGRTGGDEFMIFLKGIKDTQTILKEAQKLEYFFDNFQTGEYVKYSATASIGAAVFPTDAADYESLYKTADKALYTAKQRGKNQLVFYNEELFSK